MIIRKENKVQTKSGLKIRVDVVWFTEMCAKKVQQDLKNGLTEQEILQSFLACDKKLKLENCASDATEFRQFRKNAE